jgi:hypothetical protein
LIEIGRKRREQIEGEGERKGGRKEGERGRERNERGEKGRREKESQEKEDVDYQYLDLKKKKGPRGGTPNLYIQREGIT